MPVPVQLLPRQWLLPKLMLREGVAAQIATFVAALDPSHAYRVTVEDAKPTRTNQQNRLLWSIYGQILARGGEQMGGWTREDLHEFFLIHAFGSETKELFGKKRHVPLRRSSKLNKQEFSDFVETIFRFMAERGICIETEGALAA